MYLMALSNVDYILVTILFASVFLIAYKFRHKNATCSEFLTTANPKVDKLLAYLGDFGIVELVLASLAAAYLGFNAIYYFAIAIIAELICQRILTKRYDELNVTNCYDYVKLRCSSKTGIVLAFFNLLILLLLCSLGVAITFKILQALMGWNFVNSILGLLGITLIYMITGGNKAISYNKLLSYALMLAIIIYAAVLGFIHLHGTLTHNLTALSLAEQKRSSYYFFPLVNMHMLTLLTVLIIGLNGINLLQFRNALYAQDIANLRMHRPLTLKLPHVILARVLIMIILVLPGVFALATPTHTNTIAGKEIVTIPAQMPDGQTAYVIKTVDSTAPVAGHNNLEPGIIPPLLNAKTNLLEKGKYNYLLASIVMLRHYLPDSLSSFVLLTIVLGFMLSTADYLFKLSMVALKHIILPLKIIERYGNDGELWILRLNILGFALLSVVIGYYVATYIDLLHYMAILVMLLIAPLAAVITLIIFGVVGRHTVITSIIVGKTVAISLLIVCIVFSEIFSLPTRCAIISGTSFVFTALTGIYLWWRYEK